LLERRDVEEVEVLDDVDGLLEALDLAEEVPGHVEGELLVISRRYRKKKGRENWGWRRRCDIGGYREQGGEKITWCENPLVYHPVGGLGLAS
jgi:hypothetical protein